MKKLKKMKAIVNLLTNTIDGLLPSDIVVDLDNGHGTREYTFGKRSADGRYFEGEWSRVIVPKLADALRAIGFGVNIIVPERADISLGDRCSRANAKMKDGKYHIYISIHSNAAPAESCRMGWADNVSGLSVYCAKDGSDASLVLARNLYLAGVEFGLKGNRSVPSAGCWQANFYVLVHTAMPSALTENLFHTNRREVDFLLSEAGQETIVNYHVAGICKTFGIPYSHCTA